MDLIQNKNYNHNSLSTDHFKGTVFKKVFIKFTNLNKIKFQDCNFIEVDFGGTDIINCEFVDCNFTNCELFHTNFKDISTGSRFVKKDLIKKVKLSSNSPFVGAELAIKSKYLGYKISEMGIHTYPRTFGTGSSVSLKNIFLTNYR